METVVKSDLEKYPVAEEASVHIPSGRDWLEGELVVPEGAVGLVVFAHGTGSGRRSPRNQYVARELRRSGFGTLLLDLLTPEEETRDLEGARVRFDVDLLVQRLIGATIWLARREGTKGVPVAFFGASTGAAAALVAAAAFGDTVGAVVSRGGRPDLAGAALAKVLAPTLLIVGGNDREVLLLNEEALEALRCKKKLHIVPGATHLFEEPGKLAEVARLAAAWFRRHVSPGKTPADVEEPLDISVRGE
jgi:putative phosphoribosyl transferase